MLYHCSELVRHIPTGSELGYEDSVCINLSHPLDKQYHLYENRTHVGDEYIPLGHMLESVDGNDLKLSIWKAYGYTSHTITGTVFYEILFYKAASEYIPFKIKLRSKVYQRPLELVNYENLSQIYGGYMGGYLHVVDPRMELLGSYLTDAVVADCSGLVDRTTDVLDKHPLFGKCAYNTYSAERVRQSLLRLSSPLGNPGGFSARRGSPLELVDAILPMEIPWNVAHMFLSFPRDPKAWIFGPSPIILPLVSPLIPMSSSLQINPKGCQRAIEVLAELKGTDLDITFETDLGGLFSVAEVTSYYNPYAGHLETTDTLQCDILEIQHSALFTIVQCVKDHAYRTDPGLQSRIHTATGRVSIRIQLTSLDEALISLSDTAGVFHQIYIDLAALSLCSLGTSVVYSDMSRSAMFPHRQIPSDL